jgi:hypothetical protein
MTAQQWLDIKRQDAIQMTSGNLERELTGEELDALNAALEEDGFGPLPE